MRSTNGNVLVAVEETFTSQLASGVFRDNLFNKYHKVNIHGRVVHVPTRGDKAALADRFEGMPIRRHYRSKPYDGREYTNQTIQVGDLAYFMYLVLMDEENFMYRSGKWMIYKLHLSDVYCTVRQGQIIPNWNYVLGQSFHGEGLVDVGFGMKGTVSESGLVTNVSVKPQVDMAVIRHIGPGIYLQREGIKAGDIVMLTPDCENVNHIHGTDYWLFKHEDILAVKRGEFVFPVGDMVLVQTDRTEYEGSAAGIPGAHYLETPFTGTVVSAGPLVGLDLKRGDRVLYARKDMRMLLGNLILIQAANIQCHEQKAA